MTTIDLRNLPRRLRRIAHLLEDGGVRALRRAARASLGIVQATIDDTEPYKPVDSGHFRRGYTVDDEPDGADLYNPVPYAPVIEFGARPHMAPLEPLLEWARRKVRGSGPAGPDRERAAQALARAAQRKIATEGQEGHKILERSWPEMLRAVEFELEAELRRLQRG